MKEAWPHKVFFHVIHYYYKTSLTPPEPKSMGAGEPIQPQEAFVARTSEGLKSLILRDYPGLAHTAFSNDAFMALWLGTNLQECTPTGGNR